MREPLDGDPRAEGRRLHVPGGRWTATLRLLFALAVLLPAAASAQDAREGPPADPARARTVREALLRFAARATPERATGPLRARLDVHALELRRRLEGLEVAREKLDAVRSYFFEDQGYAATERLADPDHFYADRVVRTRSGYCLSLGALVLAVAEALDLPLRGATAPRHFYLLWIEGGERHALETTGGGRLVDERIYRERGVSSEAEAAGVYLTPLATHEVVGCLLNNEGYVHWRAGRRALAARRFAEALALFPKLPEAHVNAGIVAAEEGAAERADDHFARALALLPDDAPTLFNRALSRFRAGECGAALRVVEDALDSKGGSEGHLAQLRDGILAALLEPERWAARQKRIDAEARELEAAGRLAPGLLGHYFGDREFAELAFRRVDPAIDFEWRHGAPHRELPRDGFTVRWEGWVHLEKGGVHSFLAAVNDGLRVRVDGVRILDAWSAHEGALLEEHLDLRAGRHRLEVEYLEIRGFAGVRFEVKRAAAARPLGRAAFAHTR